MRAITPFLWFNDNLEEAVDYYTGLFPDTKVRGVRRGPDGKLVTAEFELAGQRFMGLNGGPQFRFTEAVSFFVECEDQDEVDRYWGLLTADGGEEGPCGWLKDKFGLSWQIVPVRLMELMATGTPEQVERVTAAMMTMGKLDVAAFEAAARG